MTDPAPTPLICIPEGGLDAAPLTQTQRGWAAANGFSGQHGRLLPLPGDDGARAAVLFGTGKRDGRPVLATGEAARKLDGGIYALAGDFGEPTRAALGFRLGAYRFERYVEAKPPAALAPLAGADAAEVERLARAAIIARDLINTPANDLGPEAFEAAIRKFAAACGMAARAVVGEALIEQNFPMIHAVGRASAEAPRLLDLSWGRADAPKVTLVGKGVTFDTGGLDIKTAAGMALMKKDMGGAANVLGLASALVDLKLDIRLRVLLPVVENAISGSAFRPGDVLRARAGTSVEIGNTDAEGRLILADALALADEEAPEILIDMATLTGAARVALGPELVPLYTGDDALAAELMEAGLSWDDPLWRMPLWAPYEALLKSRIADVSHVGSGGHAGSITAALFLKRFVGKAHAWVHLDIFGWAPEPRPGRPAGGTDQGIRACYEVLKRRYG